MPGRLSGEPLPAAPPPRLSPQGLLKSQEIDVAPLPPHVYATADTAYRCMMDERSSRRTVDNRNQSLLVSVRAAAAGARAMQLMAIPPFLSSFL